MNAKCYPHEWKFLHVQILVHVTRAVHRSVPVGFGPPSSVWSGEKHQTTGTAADRLEAAVLSGRISRVTVGLRSDCRFRKKKKRKMNKHQQRTKSRSKKDQTNTQTKSKKE
jgi:hypothetical protein